MNINRAQILIGLIALFLGFMAYTLRSPGSVWFVPDWLVITKCFSETPSFVRVLTYGFIDFIHPLAFALLTSGLICSDNRVCHIITCLSWFALEIFFEFGQYFKDGYLRFIPPWFENLPCLQNAKYFFLRGTFDVLDVLCIFAGSVSAFWMLSITSKRRNEERWIREGC